MKKFMSVLLSALLITSVICSAPFAVSSATEDSVTVGETSGTTGDCTWTLDDEGTLTISGNGEMGNYTFRSTQNYSWITTAPWGSNIKRVIIENGVTNIGDYAFYFCVGSTSSTLTSITIPDSVTSIGDSAFSGCTSLTSVNIPDSVTNIGDSAFCACTGLSSVTIPDNVTSIGYNAFSGCKSLTSVTIPDSVTSIGDYAFSGCTGLTSVTIPNSVKSIGDYAFSYCTSLASIICDFFNMTISDTAFQGCPAGIGKTGDCFWSCDGEGTLIISGNGKMGDHPKKYEYESYFLTIPWGANIKKVVIENGVTNIGESAFNGCKNLTSVTIPESVKSIGNNAFAECTGLTSVTIPDNVTSIGYAAFYGCTGLTRVNISNITAWCNISFMESISNPLMDAHILYLNDNIVTDLIIPDSVTNIGSNTFAGCTGLKSVTIPDSVSSIGFRAFYGCSGLSSIFVPDSVTSIGNTAFDNCSKDLVIYCNQDSAAEEYARKNNLKTNIQRFNYEILDDGTAEVTEYLDSFTDIVIPSTYKGKPVTSIKKWIFANNKEIQSVTIPDSVTKIGKGAFYNCVELKTVTMGNNVKEIFANAFEKCLYLESINLSDDLQTIGDEAFYDCRRLKKLDIPGSVTSIGGEAFTNCRSLTDITIPEGVNKLGEEGSVGYGMFENCQSLAEITIPKSVDYIQSNAFDGCKNLTIIGASGSYAKSYAAENKIPFRAISSEMAVGDTNGDSVVDILDATVIQKFAVDKVTLTDEQKNAADVNNDGVVDILDATDIQKFAVEKITKFKK